MEKIRPYIVMTWYDYDLSAFWASKFSGIPPIVQAQILWPVCPLSCLFNEIDESPCTGPSKSCGFCLAKRAKAVGEMRSAMPFVACLPFTQLSILKVHNFRSKLSRASAIVSDSLFLKTIMARCNYHIANVHVIYNGTDFSSIKPEIHSNRQKKLHFLTSQQAKRSIPFYSTSKNLKPEFPDVRFRWVGQSELPGDTFETHGYVRDAQEMEAMFRSSYLLLLPLCGMSRWVILLFGLWLTQNQSLHTI